MTDTVEQKKNAYSDEDLAQIVEEIEKIEDQKVSIMAEARGKCSPLAKKIEDHKKTGRKLGIPTKRLNDILRRRKLERQINVIDKDVPEDEVEVWEDMKGQLAFLAPVDRPEPKPAAAPKTKGKSAAEKQHDAEQADGEKVLNRAKKPAHNAVGFETAEGV